MKATSTKPAKKKAASSNVSRLTVDEQLAVALGYVNQPWPDPRIADRDFPRGVWKCPATGKLHTPRVIRLMQTPVDPNGQPFAEAEDLKEARAQERRERRAAAEREAAVIAAERAERRQQLKERAGLS